MDCCEAECLFEAEEREEAQLSQQAQLGAGSRRGAATPGAEQVCVRVCQAPRAMMRCKLKQCKHPHP